MTNACEAPGKHVQEIAGVQLLDPAATELWFAGKRLAPASRLADRFGRNEKTKVVLRLVPAGQGAPPREPVSPSLRGCLALHAARL